MELNALCLLILVFNLNISSDFELGTKIYIVGMRILNEHK